MRHPNVQVVVVVVAFMLCMTALGITAIVAFTDDKATAHKSWMQQVQDVCAGSGVKSVDEPNHKFKCDD